MNMITKLLSISAFLIAPLCYATDSSEVSAQDWVEVVMGNATGLEYKHVRDGKGWALSAVLYEKPWGDAYYYRDSNRSFDEENREYSVLRIYNEPGAWSYLDFGIGLGYADAVMAENCETVAGNDVCDAEEKSGLVVPLEASFAVGKYSGIGIKLKGSVGAVNEGVISIFIPLGKFTR
jgi:hypothetical protein